MFAASGSLDLARLLLDLLIVLVAAKLAAELAERARVPAVLGEIVAGIAIGPSGLGLIELGGDRGVSLGLVAEIGVLLLLLSVGMEMDLAELGKVGRASLAVAVIGVVAPFAGGVAVGLAFGEPSDTAIFFGAALTATSVGITARVFGDLRALATIEARIVLGAAVADDVLGLVILTVVVKVVSGGSVGVGTVAETLGLAVVFLLGTGAVGLLVVPRVFRSIHRRATSGATLVVAAFALMIGFAMLADLAKLAFIIGAFMAGLALGKTDQHERIAHDLGAIGNIFIPVFFLSIGVNTELDAMGKPSVIALAAVMSAVAVAGKLAAVGGLRGVKADKLLVGMGMIPRGEVGLIFASIGLSNGVLGGDEYGALILVVLVTTVMTPPLLRMRLGRAPATEDLGAAAVEPPGGWLDVSGTTVSVRDIPPVSATVPIALGVAARAGELTPSGELLDWFAGHRTSELQWDPGATDALVELLRADEPRSWRFLDVTGVLERALPEVAAAMHRRRADMTDLDPLGALRFPVVDRLHGLASDPALAAHFTAASHDLVLAALAADVAIEPDDSVHLARRLVNETEADRIASVVADAHLLRTRARDTAGIDEREVLQLATHLADPQHATDAHLLAIALGDMTATQRERLDAHHDLVLEALDHPELTGGEAANLAGARRLAAQHLLADPAAIERLRFAPTAYLLAHDPEELARQARLVEPLPRAGAIRVAVSPEPEPDRWMVDVACRDTDGLLARLADVLTAQRLDIVTADVATWPDGATLCSFVVRASERPAARSLGEAFEARLRRPVRAEPHPELDLAFDNAALPWHTVCTVSGADSAGVLQAVAAAFAANGAVVHSARIGTSGGAVDDRFALADRFNRKLDERTMQRIRAALAEPARRARR